MRKPLLILPKSFEAFLITHEKLTNDIDIAPVSLEELESLWNAHPDGACFVIHPKDRVALMSMGTLPAFPFPIVKDFENELMTFYIFEAGIRELDALDSFSVAFVATAGFFVGHWPTVWWGYLFLLLSLILTSWRFVRSKI